MNKRIKNKIAKRKKKQIELIIRLQQLYDLLAHHILVYEERMRSKPFPLELLVRPKTEDESYPIHNIKKYNWDILKYNTNIIIVHTEDNKDIKLYADKDEKPPLYPTISESKFDEICTKLFSNRTDIRITNNEIQFLSPEARIKFDELIKKEVENEP